MSNRTLTPWWWVVLVLASLTFLAPPALAQPAAEERDPALIKLLGLGLEAKEVRIARMLREVKVGQMTEGEFFKGLADLSAGMKEVSRLKKALTEQGGADLAAEFLGKRYPEGGSRVEEKLLTWRREQTLGAIDNVPVPTMRTKKHR